MTKKIHLTLNVVQAMSPFIGFLLGNLLVSKIWNDFDIMMRAVISGPVQRDTYHLFSIQRYPVIFIISIVFAMLSYLLVTVIKLNIRLALIKQNNQFK